MYIMRWHKPLLPHEPITLTEDWVAPLFAFMYMGSSISGERGSKDISRFAMMKPEIEDLAFSVSPHNATSTDTSTGNVLSAAAAKAILAESEDEQSADCGCAEPKSTASPVFKLATKTSHAELRAIKLSTRTTTSGFFERRPQRSGLAEKWLWRSSSAYIGFAGVLWIVLNGVAQVWQPLNMYWEGWMEGKGQWWDNVLIGTTATVCGVSFLLARGCLIVEAFISIRQPPAAASQTPDWTQVFPHF